MYFNEEQINKKLKTYIRLNFARDKDAAAHYGLWPSQLSEILNIYHVKQPTDSMLDDIGCKKVIRYIKVKHKSCDVEE